MGMGFIVSCVTILAIEITLHVHHSRELINANREHNKAIEKLGEVGVKVTPSTSTGTPKEGSSIPTDYPGFVATMMASWLEATFDPKATIPSSAYLLGAQCRVAFKARLSSSCLARREATTWMSGASPWTQNQRDGLRSTTLPRPNKWPH
jgi:hypothetical protein